jgi:phosphate starvation-inducible membrane PsiE
MTLRQIDALRQRANRLSVGVGNLVVDVFHHFALFIIGAAVVWSALYAFWGMMSKGHASIEDILLLFIYLELGAMVGIYFKTNHMPVRFLIYVAITALTRMLLGDIQTHHQPDAGIILIAVAILLLALSTLIIRYGSSRFPAAQTEAAGEADVRKETDPE